MIDYKELWDNLFYKINDRLKECEAFNATCGNNAYYVQKLIFEYMAEQVKQAEKLESTNKGEF